MDQAAPPVWRARIVAAVASVVGLFALEVTIVGILHGAQALSLTHNLIQAAASSVGLAAILLLSLEAGDRWLPERASHRRVLVFAALIAGASFLATGLCQCQATYAAFLVTSGSFAHGLEGTRRYLAACAKYPGDFLPLWTPFAAALAVLALSRGRRLGLVIAIPLVLVGAAVLCAPALMLVRDHFGPVHEIALRLVGLGVLLPACAALRGRPGRPSEAALDET